MVGRDVGALGKHLALIGFMGAGKTTVGRRVAKLVDRPFVDLDAVIEDRHGPIPELFERGEPAFRRIEQELALDVLEAREPAVVALGGGVVELPENRDLLRRTAFAVYLDVDVDRAWARVKDSDRPLAQREVDFRRLYDLRRALYLGAADAIAGDVEDVLLAALEIELVGGSRRVAVRPQALVADERVLEVHPLDLGCPVYPVPSGEPAKRLEVAGQLWEDFDLDRSGSIVGYGGGTTTDLAGFAAAGYLRGVAWISWPTTLVGQVDAGIGGKTGVDLAKGKNLVGAFHYPRTVILDPALLGTLPPEERKAGMAEVVKTGLLTGRPLWELEDEAMVRACAAYKASVCLSDPFEQTGRRAILNLGHTFGHALEAASGFTLRHGDAVALGLLAALRLSGQSTEVVEDVLAPEPVAVDRDRAWEAMYRDKKAKDGRIRLVLLEEPGRPVFPAERPEDEVRAALDALIRK
ncbi:MAG TPA: bifunctional shikimate kinase/3-dehydroquinate synthase [Gaiellaceae bacterium]